ncbi:hypothetical protein V4V36_17950 [Paenibacillus lautus]
MSGTQAYCVQGEQPCRYEPRSFTMLGSVSQDGGLPVGRRDPLESSGS